MFSVTIDLSSNIKILFYLNGWIKLPSILLYRHLVLKSITISNQGANTIPRVRSVVVVGIALVVHISEVRSNRINLTSFTQKLLLKKNNFLIILFLVTIDLSSNIKIFFYLYWMDKTSFHIVISTLSLTIYDHIESGGEHQCRSPKRTRRWKRRSCTHKRTS